MWLFTRYGFYSVASAQTPEGALDPGTVMVRPVQVAPRASPGALSGYGRRRGLCESDA